MQPASPASVVPLELWQRLRRFDPQCEIALVRTNPMYDSPFSKASPPFKRVWVTSIRPMSMVAKVALTTFRLPFAFRFPFARSGSKLAPLPSMLKLAVPSNVSLNSSS